MSTLSSRFRKSPTRAFAGAVTIASASEAEPEPVEFDDTGNSAPGMWPASAPRESYLARRQQDTFVDDTRGRALSRRVSIFARGWRGEARSPTSSPERGSPQRGGTPERTSSPPISWSPLASPPTSQPPPGAKSGLACAKPASPEASRVSTPIPTGKFGCKLHSSAGKVDVPFKLHPEKGGGAGRARWVGAEKQPVTAADGSEDRGPALGLVVGSPNTAANASKYTFKF